MKAKNYCCEMVSVFETTKIVYYDTIESCLESVIKSLEMEFNIEGKIYSIQDNIEPVIVFKKVDLH